jgi:hypothetical protein
MAGTHSPFPRNGTPARHFIRDILPVFLQEDSPTPITTNNGALEPHSCMLSVETGSDGDA